MRSITHGKEKGTWQIFSINTDGTGEQQLTSARYSNANPSWAPDGRLAFTSNRTGRYLIYVMDNDGSGQTVVTSPPEGLPGDAEPGLLPERSQPDRLPALSGGDVP